MNDALARLRGFCNHRFFFLGYSEIFLSCLEFGGDKRFTPPLVVSDQCARNCSFVAGDPAFGFYFTAWALALPAQAWLWPFAFALGLLLGLARIGMGAHFLSDVIYSGVLNCTLAAALAWPLLRRQGGVRD